MNEVDDDIVKWFANELPPERQRGLEERMAREEEFREQVERYRVIWNNAARLKVRPGLPREARLKRLHDEMDKNAKRVSFARRPVLRYAAVLLVLFLASGLLYRLFENDVQRLETKYGEIRTIELPDHSTVVMNAGSSIQYDAAPWHSERKVMMTGEAFFDVAKTGAPFIVLAGNANVEVVGTTFNIKSRESGSTMIACLSGKVRVTGDGHKPTEVALTEGLGAEVDKEGSLVPYVFNTNEVMGWRYGELYFENTALKEVFADFERYFDKHIEVPAEITAIKFTGKFDKPDLHNAMETVCRSAGLTYYFEADSTIVVKNGQR